MAMAAWNYEWVWRTDMRYFWFLTSTYPVMVLKNLKAGLFSRKFACRCYKICTCQREEIHQAPGSWRWSNILHPCLNSAATHSAEKMSPEQDQMEFRDWIVSQENWNPVSFDSHTKHFLKLIGSYTRQSALVLHQLAKDNNGISYLISKFS